MDKETGEITDITFLPHQRVSFVLRLRQSFPEDCARLKLSSARASQAGLKEMMTRRRVRGCLGSRTEGGKSYAWREITESTPIQSIHSAHGRRSGALTDLDASNCLLRCA